MHLKLGSNEHIAFQNSGSYTMISKFAAVKLFLDPLTCIIPDRIANVYLYTPSNMAGKAGCPPTILAPFASLSKGRCQVNTP